MPVSPVEQFLPWGVAALASIGLVIALFRSRRPRGYAESDAVDVIELLVKATRGLRHEGLSQFQADRIANRLLPVLDCVAVGITDPHGTLLSWDGEANDHYEYLKSTLGTVLVDRRRAVVMHNEMPCGHRNTCRINAAAIIPLVVEDEIAAVLILVSRGRPKKLMEAAEVGAHFVRTEFRLTKLQEAHKKREQAEIKALRAQISPHFIYNALNTISSLIRTDPDEARELLQDFADFARYSFRTTGVFTSLAEELRNVDRYLTLESARLGGQLEVRLKIAPEVLSIVVPFLIIQPLVENAVKHGLAQKPGGGTITVIAQDEGVEALISVEDDGVGMDPEELEKLRLAHHTGAHVGLGNVNERMMQAFGPEYPLTIDTAVGAGMKVMLRIPKFARGVRAELPHYEAEVPEQATGLEEDLDMGIDADDDEFAWRR